jgi:hypothetical protein
MKTPVPWRTDSEPTANDEQRAGELLERAQPVREWPESQQKLFFQRLAEKTSSGSRQHRSWVLAHPLRLAWAPVALVLTLVVIAWQLWPSRTTRPVQGEDLKQVVELASVGRLVVKPAGQLVPDDIETTRKVHLAKGTLEAQVVHQDPARPLTIETPHFRVVVVGTQFTIEVHPEYSSVQVDQGRVRVELLKVANATHPSVFVSAGEHLRSDDPRLLMASEPSSLPGASALATTPNSPLAPGTNDLHRAPVPSTSPRPTEELADGKCDATGMAPAERESCLSTLSAGQGLAAQNALYELGLLDRSRGEHVQAAARWEELERRFPQGPLAPDASSGLITEWVTLEHFPEALAETQSFLDRFPMDPKAAEVKLIRANLFRERFDRPEQALPLYSEVLSKPVPNELKDEAMYFEGVCQQALGRTAEASRTWHRYLATFPHGNHRNDVEHVLH